MAEQKSSESNLGPRLLIIVFAFGLVLIGAYPYKHRVNKLVWYLRQQTTALADTLQPLEGMFPDSQENGKRQADRSSSRAALSQPKQTAPKHVDRITDSDRSELNRLIGALSGDSAS
jgi:hypothetical protein